MNQKQKVVICTLKSWNLAEAARFKLANKAQYDVTIISEKASLNREVLEHIAPDYLFFPHWSSIIPKEIYENHRCVVFHMTDLPYGRGGSPLQNLISRGIQETVITAIRAVQVLDGGEVYLKRPLKLNGSAQEIFERACQVIFRDMIPYILTHHPQPAAQVGEITTFQRRTPQESILPQNATSEKLYDHIRMLDAEGYPAAFIEYGGFRLCFRNAQLNRPHLTTEVVFLEDINPDRGV